MQFLVKIYAGTGTDMHCDRSYIIYRYNVMRRHRNANSPQKSSDRASLSLSVSVSVISVCLCMSLYVCLSLYIPRSRSHHSKFSFMLLHVTDTHMNIAFLFELLCIL